MQQKLAAAHSYKSYGAAAKIAETHLSPRHIDWMVSNEREDGRYVVVALPKPDQIQDAISALWATGCKLLVHAEAK